MSKVTNLASVSAFIKTLDSIYNRLVAADTEVSEFNANKALITDADGRISESGITKAEIDKLDGIDGLTSTIYAEYPRKSTAQTITGDWIFSKSLTMTIVADGATRPTDVPADCMKMFVCDEGGIHLIDENDIEYVILPQGNHQLEMWFNTTGDIIADPDQDEWMGLSGLTNSPSSTGFVYTEGVPELDTGAASISGWSSTSCDIDIGSDAVTAGYVDGAAVTVHDGTSGDTTADIGIITAIAGDVITVKFNTITSGTRTTLIQPCQVYVEPNVGADFLVSYTMSFETLVVDQHITTTMVRVRPSGTPGSVIPATALVLTPVKTQIKQWITKGETGSMYGQGISTEMEDGDIVFIAIQTDNNGGSVQPLLGNLRLTP